MVIYAVTFGAQTSVADFIIESIYDLQGKENDERVESPIRTMRKRFDDVSSWATYVILTQLLPDERRAAFGCLLRVAITCWNIGNFIGAKEIITGLRWVNWWFGKMRFITWVAAAVLAAVGLEEKSFHSHSLGFSLLARSFIAAIYNTREIRSTVEEHRSDEWTLNNRARHGRWWRKKEKSFVMRKVSIRRGLCAVAE